MTLKTRQKYFIWAFVFVLFAGMVYLVPRFLVSVLGEQSPWIGYIYTYTLGGFVFVASLLRLYRAGKFQRKQNRLWILALCFGLFWGLLIHGLWIYFSISFPFKG